MWSSRLQLRHWRDISQLSALQRLIHVNASTHLHGQRKLTSLIAFPRHLYRSGAAEQSWEQHRASLEPSRPVTGLGKMESLLEPTPDLAWVLAAEGFDPLREAIYELRFSISNGLLGLRAGRAVSRGERWVVPHRAYVAGMFDIPGPEHPIPALVPAPGWQQFRIMLPGGPLVRHPGEAISHRTILDMRRGVLLTGSRLIDRPAIAVASEDVAPPVAKRAGNWGPGDRIKDRGRRD